jgi:hypothetical protein
MRSFSLVCLLILASVFVCFGQEASRIKVADEGNADNEQVRIQVLRTSLLSRIDEAVRLMDEPAIRALISSILLSHHAGSLCSLLAFSRR